MNQTIYHLPKPTWADPAGRVILYCADNRDVLPMLGAESVQAIITDPPYGFSGPDDQGRRRNIGRYQGSNSDSGRGRCEYRELDINWNDELPLTWVRPGLRALVPGGAFVAWTDNLRPHKLQTELETQGGKFLRLLYWWKTNPPTNPSKNHMNAVESAVFGRKPGKVNAWNAGATEPNIMGWAKPDHNLKSGECGGHETVKPLRIMEWSINLYTKPQDWVLDPFMGSGTTGKASVSLNRRFIGVERDPSHFETSLTRIKDVLEQGRLF